MASAQVELVLIGLSQRPDHNTRPPSQLRLPPSVLRNLLFAKGRELTCARETKTAVLIAPSKSVLRPAPIAPLMTEVLARSPLDSLSMSAAQTRTRRTSARTEEAEDHGPPAKKQKTEKVVRAPPKQVNGKKDGPPAKQSNRVYDQTADDFTFSKKTKKPPPNKPEPMIEEGPQPDDTQVTASALVPKGRKRKSKSLEAAPAAQRPNEPRRRSKRLSGESNVNGEQQQQHQPAITGTSDTADQDRGRPRQLHRTPRDDQKGGLHVYKKRRATKIALPFADTPVIQRNREMRHTSSENRRRSSSTMRGRRASSLIDSGMSNAVPHDNVEMAEFYKHISQELPEPRRMKQLLTWCGARSLAESPSDDADVSATLAARVIQDELLKDFANKSEMSDWFSREDDVAPVVLVKKPNPRNVQNAAKLKELEQEVTRLEQEKSTWDSLLGSLSSSMSAAASTTRSEFNDPVAPTAIDESLLADDDQVECLRVLNAQADAPERTRSRIQESSESLEFRIDSFAGGVQKLEQLEGVVKATADQAMRQASSALEERDKGQLGKADNAASVGDILRAFSRAAS